MKFQSFEKTDQKIIGSAILVFILSSVLLWQDGWIYSLVSGGNKNLSQIGVVTTMNNDVRRRHEVDLSWLPLRQENNVFQGDSIFTGENSTAIIKTMAGEEITIAPNSLVVISQKTDSISLNIGFGSVEGRVGAGKKLIVSTNNNITELDGAGGVVKVDAGEGNKLLVNVVAGEVRLKSKDGDKILRQEDFSEILPDGSLGDAQKPNIQVISPLANQFLQHKPDQPVVFQWKTPRKFARMKIKIAYDEGFKNSVVDTRVNDNQYSGYNLPKDAPLYWQILAEGGVSPINKLTIVGDRPPIPISPKPGMHFYFNPLSAQPQSGADVDLTWEEGSPANLFEIALSKNESFTREVKTFKAQQKSLALKELPKGQYFWRVRSLDFENGQWSAISQFKVGPEPTLILAPPLPQMAEGQFLIETAPHNQSANKIHNLTTNAALKLVKNKIRIRWSTVTGAEKYLVQVSKTKDFTDLIAQSNSARTNYKLNPLLPGTYFWRTKAQSAEFKDGHFTPMQILTVGVAPPLSRTEALINEEVTDSLLLNSAPLPLKLQWQPTVFTYAYEVEIAANSSFEGAQKFITNQTERQIALASPGIYFWRVRALSKDQKPLGPFSSSYTLEFQRTYRDPTISKELSLIYPKQEDSIILIGKNKSEIEFKWTKPHMNAQYTLELALDPDFKNIFFSKQTSDNFYKHTEPFNTNVLYWRVRADAKDFSKEWTPGNRFLVSYESDPFRYDNSEALYAARLRARDRQQQLLALQARKLAQLRTPASALELQLDTPQIINPLEHYVLEPNLDPNVPAAQISQQPFEKFYGQIKNYPQFRWAKVTAAERYVFEIAKDPEFKISVSKTPCWDPHFVWDAPRPGRFYYRVQAFNDRYTRSRFSTAEKIDISVASPVPTSPDNVVDVFDEPREMWPPPSPFYLTWTPTVFARGYEVEFSEDKTFQSTKVFRTREPRSELRVTKSGLYYWRVRPISDAGVGISPYSPVRSIEVLQTQRMPASVSSITGLFPKERTMVFVGKGLMNLAFYWVSPEPSPFYDVEISTHASFNNIISRTRSRRPTSLVREDLPEGTLYWRVKSGDKISSINKFYLRKEPQPYTEAPPFAPNP